MNQGNNRTKKGDLKTYRWSPGDFLTDSWTAAAYLEAAFEDGDPQLVLAALGDVARAKGMTRLASDSGLSRESLYKALSVNGNPSLATVLSVFRALNLRLQPTVATLQETQTNNYLKLWDKGFPSSGVDLHLFSMHDGEAWQETVRESLESGS